MECRINKNTVARNFSRYAHIYDKYADIQRLAAEGLIKELPSNGIKNILEIGCGTGNYTRLLRERFKDSSIKALDISRRMIEVAKEKFPEGKIDFILVDAEEVNINDKFDLITSNAAFQWFNNLERVFVRYKKALKKNGVIAFTSFGPFTFLELNQSLREVLDKDVSISSANFLEKGELNTILKRHFKEVWMKELIVKEKHSSFGELLKKIKYTGARGRGANGHFLWSEGLLKKIEEAYNKRFGRIEATYQIFFLRAVR